MLAVIGQLNHLAAGDVAGIECEFDECAHPLPPLASGGSGIDGEHAQLAVGDDLEDVAMSAHKEFGLRELQTGADARSIAARIAADVGHDHLHALGLENLGFLEAAAEQGTVGITIDRAQHRHEMAESVGHLLVANVARMPNLVAVAEVNGISVVPVTSSDLKR